jgi:hypothetical protein
MTYLSDQEIATSLTVDDGFTGIDDDASRIRFQWDVSF